MTKKDYINSLIVGEIIASFCIVLFFTLKSEIPDKFLFFNNIVWFSVILFPLLGVSVVSSTSLLRERWLTVSQFGKFCFVGLSNFTIDFGILNLLIYSTGYHKGIYYAVFKGFSFLIAQGNSYAWNSLWTFDESEKSSFVKQFVKFLSVVLIGLIINVSIASFIVETFSDNVSFSSAVWANLGAMISMIITILWNFIGLRIFVFKNSG